MQAVISNGIKVIFLTSMLFMAMYLSAQNQTSKDMVGKWQGEEKSEIQVEIYEAQDGKFYGKLMSNPPKKEEVLVFKALVWNEKDKTYQGTFQPPQINLEAKITIAFVGKDKFEFTVKKFLMSKTLRFVRMK